MNFKQSFLAGLVVLGVSLSAIAPAQAGSAPSTPDADFLAVKKDILTEMKDVITRFAFVPGADFGTLENRLTTRQADLDRAENPSAFVRVVNQALQEYGFSHIVLFSPSDAERRNSGRMVGIGIRIQLEEDGIRVMFTFADSPSARGGLMAGDLIFEADGRPVRTAGDLAGEEGSEVTIRYRRGTEVRTATLKRERFSTVIPESVKWMNPEVALITIPTFDTGYDRKNVEDVLGQAQNAKFVILDLRSNGGGAVANLMHLAGFFMPRTNNLGTFVDKTTYNRYIQAHEGEENPTLGAIATWARRPIGVIPQTTKRLTGKVIVLIDGGTGSASEMMAASMRDQMKSKLIGSSSAGAVLASLIRPMKHDFAIQFPITDYVTPGGYRIEGNGLKPDIEADPIIRYNQPDAAVNAAMKDFGFKVED
ncbi:MAG: PDZ domain-containing protein [Fimbriimonadaceae bacterium]|nr:PDZ domain-containing protein [Fimbriimonadaceae bacterium]